MKSNSVEQTIEEIGEDINVAERFEQGLHETVEDKIPVDIQMSIGGKGVPGYISGMISLDTGVQI